LPLTGTYTVLIEDRAFQTPVGNYIFNIQPVADDTAALTIGTRVAGAIAQKGQIDRYTFTLAAPARLIMDVLQAAPSDNLQWTLTGPSGTPVNARALHGSDSIDGSPLLDLVAGDYVL
jgi:hypothetical protein